MLVLETFSKLIIQKSTWNPSFQNFKPPKISHYRIVDVLNTCFEVLYTSNDAAMNPCA